MLLMIFVNDLWTLEHVPAWLGHAGMMDDRLGFSDVIFPAFLFIVGMSVPLAIEGRLKKGESRTAVQKHIVIRAFALIIMGVFHYNLENYSDDALLPRAVWELLLTIAFFLVWLDYTNVKERTSLMLKITGVVMLIGLSAVYKGTYGSGPWMQIGWWGILGLIGWTYLIVSSIYLWSNGEIRIQYAAFSIFLLLNCLDINHSANAAIAMAGVITTLHYRKNGFWTFASVAIIALIVLGFVARSWWDISKIRATPPWVLICTGISVATFLIIAFIVDVKRQVKWYEFIKPAGTVTLTCYLLPYIHSGLFQLLNIRLPLVLRTEAIGLLKSLIFAWLIITIAGFLKKKGIALKL